MLVGSPVAHQSSAPGHSASSRHSSRFARDWAGIVEDRESTPVSSRTPVGDNGASWVRPVTSGGGEQWLAAVWVRDLDGRRRLVQARRRGRREAEVALEERLARRRPLGSRGAEPDMTVQELGEYWMRRRFEEVRAPSTMEPRCDDVGAVSPQTLAGTRPRCRDHSSPRWPAADRSQDGCGR